MDLLPIEEIKINQVKINKIDHLVKSIYRLIMYSRNHLDDDLLDAYLTSIQELQELLSIKRRGSGGIFEKPKNIAWLRN